METLFVDQTIVINAPIETVWQVITDRSYTSPWAKEFTNGVPLLIDSEWQLSSPVLWKDRNQKVIVEGAVTAVDKPHLLRFTVFAADRPHASVTDEDGITWSIQSCQNTTSVRVRQGNFAFGKGGKKDYEQTTHIWSRILPVVKEISEEI